MLLFLVLCAPILFLIISVLRKKNLQETFCTGSQQSSLPLLTISMLPSLTWHHETDEPTPSDRFVRMEEAGSDQRAPAETII